MLISCFTVLYKPAGSKINVTILPKNTSTAAPTPTTKPKATAAPSTVLPAQSGSTNQTVQQIQNLPQQPPIIGTAPLINSTIWKEVAANARAYYSPGIGVDPNTGLPYAAGKSFPDFTDWDLGVYIQAVIAAEKIGLIGTDGRWGSTERIDYVLNFLQTRPLNSTTHYPFWFYNAKNGQDDSEEHNAALVDIVDTGILFVALNNLKNFNNSFAAEIDSVVHDNPGNPNGGSNYVALLPTIQGCSSSNSIYAYTFTSGFASFWPTQVGNVPNQILNNIVNSPTVTSPYGNISLPDAPISCDPLLLAVFDLNNQNSQLMNLMNQVYLAHEAFYNATGEFQALGEGNSPDMGYIWEWVVASNGAAWQVFSQDINGYINIDPSTYIIYTKVAYSFLALYNTTFAKNMCAFLEQKFPSPAKGYYGGAHNLQDDLYAQVDSNTNGLILQAALYAMQK